MEHLEIRTSWRNTLKYNKLGGEVSAELSRLQHLTLDGCGMSWEVSRFANLRTLDISRLPEVMEPSRSQLLDMLRQMPLLESLTATSIKRSNDFRDRTSQYTAPIHLQHLVRMKISCGLLDCIFLLNHISFSRDARRITLKLEVPSQQQMDESSVITSVKSLAQTLENKFDGLAEKIVLDYPLRVRMSKDPSLPLSVPFCMVELNFIGAELFSDDRDGPREAFWQSLNLDWLSALSVRDDDLVESQWSIFGNLPHLESLSVFLNESPLLRVLKLDTKSPPSLAFPALKHLKISDWYMYSESGQKSIDQLASCLQLRDSVWLHLESLRLENCFGLTDDREVVLDRLRNVVKDVDSRDEYDEDEDIQSQTYGDV
ncbi:hypothetical protein C0995_010420 [Termitomyces sp. Mi166|nr:hypothetical protein C0995_010420 [Termitomyces sp. Mi166\